MPLDRAEERSFDWYRWDMASADPVGGRSDAHPTIEELVALVDAVPDRALASGYVRSVLRSRPVEDIADLVSLLHAAAASRDPRASEAWLLVAIVLATELELAQAIARALRARGSPELAEAMDGGAERPTDEDAYRVPDFGRGRPLTLGERKSVARTRDRALLLRVLGDPHPAVIRILLGNPHLTEADVVRLCARRPVAPEVLREVCASPRWIVRAGVRAALVKNPALPLPLALRLVPRLTAPDLRAVAASTELDPRLREACAAALRPPTLH